MKNKVGSKFYWFIAISVCLSILISSITVAFYLLDQFKKEVLQKDELHLKGLVGNVEGFIDRSYSLNYQLSVNPIVIENLLNAPKEWNKRLQAYISQYEIGNGLSDNGGLPLFVQMQKQYDFVELFFLQDAQGRQTARSFGIPGLRNKRWWYRKIMADENHSPFVSKSYYSLTGDKPVSTIFHPVLYKEKLIGILGTDINFDFLQTFVSKHIYSKDLYAMITDNEGVVIAHPKKEMLRKIYNLKNMSLEILETKVSYDGVLDNSGHMKTTKSHLDWDPKISAIVKNAIQGKSGFEQEVILKGKSHTLYYHPVAVAGSDKNFTVILVRDQSTLIATKFKILFFVIGFTVCTIFILIFLFHFFFKRFILKPLGTLTSSIKKADLLQTSPVTLKSNDEFETLAETFNELHNKLKKARSNLVELNEKLEEKVEIRTTELRLINQELSKEIDEHRITTEKLREARDQAESASHAKSQFLANISHELRTPMHGILSFVTLGLSKIDTLKRGKIKQFLGEIHSSAHRLLNLLNDLLDLSRLESGKEKYIFEEHRLSPVVSKAITEMSAFQRDKDITVTFEEPNFDDRALFDGAKITQVLQNLISNAIKFSNEGGKVQLSLTESERNILVAVADNGVGIPVDELESVFDKFVQSSKTATGAGGTGLGLSICQKIIGDHQGKIWAEINPKGGTVLKFMIPKRI